MDAGDDSTKITSVMMAFLMSPLRVPGAGRSHAPIAAVDQQHLDHGPEAQPAEKQD